MNITGIIIILLPFIPLTIFSFFHRKIRKCKPLSYDQYTAQLQDFKANISILDVEDEDIKKIKNSMNTSAYIIGVVIFIDIFAILIFISTIRNGSGQPLACIVFFVLLFFFSFLCIAITLKRDNIFRQKAAFRKQTGIILDYKAKYYASNAYKRPAIYTVKLGTYINNNTEPIVVQMDIPSVVFNYVLRGEPWWIITYKNAPVTVIRGGK